MIIKPQKSIILNILGTIIIIMLVSGILIGGLIFNRWFDYAEKATIDIHNRLNHDIVELVKTELSVVDELDETFFEKINPYVTEREIKVAILDENSQKIISMGSLNPVLDDNRSFGNEALDEAYHLYMTTDDSIVKISNDEGNLFVHFNKYYHYLIITALPDNPMTASIRETMITTIRYGLIASCATIIIYYFAVKRLVKPINLLLESTHKFGRGDRTARAQIVRDDEIGVISKAFNSMAATIEFLFNQMEDQVSARTLELEEANNLLTESRNSLKLILDSTGEAFYGVDQQGIITFVNPSCVRLLGYSHEDDLIGQKAIEIFHQSQVEDSPLAVLTTGKASHSTGNNFYKRNGLSFDAEYHAYPQIKDGEIVGAVVTFVDITLTKKAKERIDYLNAHDGVTGLYNRRTFESELIKIDTPDNLPISILYGDVNGLKLINDIYGHEKGDMLLKRTAEVIKRHCRKSDIIARVGGDEFIIIQPRTDDLTAQRISHKIETELAKEVIFGIKGNISMAASTKKMFEENIQLILANAESSMYKRKTLNRRQADTELLENLMSTLFNKSPLEKEHTLNVSALSENLALALGLPQTQIKLARDAGYYHDIGKITLSEAILNNTGELNPQQLAIKERHPMTGYRVLNLFFETINIAEIVLSHHESFDGSGYPKGLTGDEIPLIARIVRIAEDYDHMIRRLEMSRQDALNQIHKGAGHEYDPRLVEHFNP